MSDRMICMLSNYAEFPRTLKERIRAVQAEAVLSVSRELVFLFGISGIKFLNGKQLNSGTQRSLTGLLLIFIACFPTCWVFHREIVKVCEPS